MRRARLKVVLISNKPTLQDSPHLIGRVTQSFGYGGQHRVSLLLVLLDPSYVL